MDKDDTPFYFKPMINAHERDTKIFSKLTKLTIGFTIPDLLNKMNVSAAKVPFTYETVIEMFCHFGEHLKCQDDMKLKGAFDENKGNTLINFKRLDIIDDALEKTTDEVSPLVKSGIVTLTYCVHIGSIFIEYFMNKTKKITKDNITETEILMKKILCYFARWR